MAHCSAVLHRSAWYCSRMTLHDNLKRQLGMSIYGATSLGRVEELRHFLRLGVSPDLRTEGGERDPYAGLTPLHYLCKGHDCHGDRAACFRLLKDAGADLEATNTCGHTPLHFAVTDSVSIVPMLIEEGVNVNAVSDHGDTPLHYASKFSRQKNAVAALVRAGAAINARNTLGRTPLYIAITYGNRRVFPLLLRAGAEIPPAYAKKNIEPYLHRIVAAGGFKKYEQAHIARITKILAPTPRLPPEMVRKIVEFWLHAGYY